DAGVRHARHGVELDRELPERRFADRFAHAALSFGWAPAARNAVTMRSGVRGMSVKRTPNGDSASSMAAMIAAGAGMVPPSPAPLTPSGLSGFGVSTCSITAPGMSEDAGRR